jgi:hypothetical protein
MRRPQFKAPALNQPIESSAVPAMCHFEASLTPPSASGACHVESRHLEALDAAFGGKYDFEEVLSPRSKRPSFSIRCLRIAPMRILGSTTQSLVCTRSGAFQPFRLPTQPLVGQVNRRAPIIQMRPNPSFEPTCLRQAAQFKRYAATSPPALNAPAPGRFVRRRPPAHSGRQRSPLPVCRP